MAIVTIKIIVAVWNIALVCFVICALPVIVPLFIVKQAIEHNHYHNMKNRKS